VHFRQLFFFFIPRWDFFSISSLRIEWHSIGQGRDGRRGILIFNVWSRRPVFLVLGFPCVHALLGCCFFRRGGEKMNSPYPEGGGRERSERERETCVHLPGLEMWGSHF